MSPLFCHLTCLGWYLGYFRGIRVFYSAQHSLQRYYTPPPIKYSSVCLPIIMHLWRFSRETKLVGIIWSNINLYIKRERRRKGHEGKERWEISGNGLTWLWSLLSPKSAGWAGWRPRGEVMSQLESESDLRAEFPLSQTPQSFSSQDLQVIGGGPLILWW